MLLFYMDKKDIYKNKNCGIIKTMPICTHPYEIVKQIIASANSRREMHLIINTDKIFTCKDIKNFEQEINTLLKRFELFSLNSISYKWEEKQITIHLKVWNGHLLFTQEDILYIRSNCTISELLLNEEKERYFTPYVIS